MVSNQPLELVESKNRIVAAKMVMEGKGFLHVCK